MVEDCVCSVLGAFHLFVLVCELCCCAYYKLRVEACQCNRSVVSSYSRHSVAELSDPVLPPVIDVTFIFITQHRWCVAFAHALTALSHALVTVRICQLLETNTWRSSVRAVRA